MVSSRGVCSCTFLLFRLRCVGSHVESPSSISSKNVRGFQAESLKDASAGDPISHLTRPKTHLHASIIRPHLASPPSPSTARPTTSLITPLERSRQDLLKCVERLWVLTTSRFGRQGLQDRHHILRPIAPSISYRLPQSICLAGSQASYTASSLTIPT